MDSISIRLCGGELCEAKNKAANAGSDPGVWVIFHRVLSDLLGLDALEIFFDLRHAVELFKMDAVCGGLREEKVDVFIEMMKECRKYSPELILLNHRLRLGRAMPYATTSLLGGQETYMDIHLSNGHTAPHHRESMFHREPPPGLTRLTEDHGVCISSCIDYFEDELIYQAFNRMILFP